MIKRLSLIMVALMGFLLFSQNSDVHACTPTPTPLPESTPLPVYTLEDRLNNADIVLLGTVISGDILYGQAISSAEVAVERYLKGNGEAIVEVEGFGDSAMCLASVQVGSRYIFLARANADGTLQGTYFHGYSPLVNPSEENIAEIIAVTNQSIAVESQDYQSQTAFGNDSGWIILISVTGVLAIIAFAIYRLVSDPRKPKAKRS